MPNMKNAKKKVIVDAKKKAGNNDFKASMRTAMKNVEKALLNKDVDGAKEKLAVAIKRIDKAKAKGVVTPNFAARNKSRLTKKVNEMK